MNFRKEYQQLILPLLRSMPVIMVLIAGAVVFTQRSLRYVNPKYKASGAIKINNLDYSIPSINLFGEESTSRHQQSETFLSEVEVFKTRQLTEHALEKTDFHEEIFRVGKVNLVELYSNRPFTIEVLHIKPAYYGHLFHLRYIGGQQFALTNPAAPDEAAHTIEVGKVLRTKYFHIALELNDDFLSQKPQSLRVNDLFGFKHHSMEQLASRYSGSALFVKPIDKEVSIIKVYFEHEVPEKAQLFVNSLLETYIEDARSNKEQQALQTIGYIDERLEQVGKALQEAEAQLAYFRSSNKIINPLQETDAALKELTQLDFSKLQTSMQKAELSRLYDFLASGNTLQQFAPNLDVLEDNNFEEAFRKAQNYELKKQDLLLKYAPESEEVQSIERKIKQMRTFMHESVGQTLSNLRLRAAEIDRSIDDVNTAIKDYPHKERKLAQLSRNVQIKEQIYNHLMKKRTELAIAKSSNVIPHRIIDRARLPRQISSPNRPLMYGLAIFIALLIGMVYAYIVHFFTARVKRKEDLTDRLPFPILGTVPAQKNHMPRDYVLMNKLVTNIRRHRSIGEHKRGQWITITSHKPNEGKTFITSNLGKALAITGKKVLIVDMDVYKPELHEQTGSHHGPGLADILKRSIHALDAVQATVTPGLSIISAGVFAPGEEPLIYADKAIHLLQDMRWHFDYIIVDTPSLSMSSDAALFMHESDINLFCVRAGHTRKKALTSIQQLIEEYDLQRLQLVLNSTSINIPSHGKPSLAKRGMRRLQKVKTA
jgi:capsular exopolysaccharide synthesis family protein